MLSFSPNLTMLHLVIAVLVSTTAVAFGVMRFLRTVEAAEERATLHAWQLRQLVPNRSV